MITVRRWYIFLVSGISLNAVAWAIIALLRNLLIPGLSAPRSQIAFEIAVIIIGMPFYLAHWLWIQRLSREQAEERASVLRQYYLYAMMTGFLAPLVTNAVEAFGAMLSQVFQISQPNPFVYQLSSSETIVYHLVALVALALFWQYHHQLATLDSRMPALTKIQANPRRLYVYGFGATGLSMVAVATNGVVRWLLFQLDNTPVIVRGTIFTEVKLLLVGLPLWLVFWTYAKRLFESPEPSEKASALRKLYLYVAVFAGVILAVVNTTFILASGLRSLLGLTALGDIRGPLPLILVGAVLWSYHVQVLRTDTVATSELPRQAGIRRLYLYLMAGIGLTALLVGLAGDISVLIRSLSGRPLISSTREQLAWFTATLIAGLPVWIVPWRQLQSAANRVDSTGESERQSIIRRIYLYFFLFVAAITLLSSGIYIVSQLIELALGARTSRFLVSDMAQAIAFAVIAASVWAYHITSLRADGRYSAQAESGRLKALQVVFVDRDTPPLVSDAVASLVGELPQLKLQTIDLATARPDSEVRDTADLAILNQADVIIASWTLVTNQESGRNWATMIDNSPARKLIIPVRETNWDWLGVKYESTDTITEQLIQALKQIAAGDEVAPARSPAVGTILAVIVGVLILLSVMAPLAVFLVQELF